MTPVQEIIVQFANGDRGIADIIVHPAHFSSQITLYAADGNIFAPLKSPPFATAALAFEALLTSALGLAGTRGTAIDAIDNPVNCEFVDKAAQIQIAQKHGLTAPILVNGV